MVSVSEDGRMASPAMLKAATNAIRTCAFHPPRGKLFTLIEQCRRRTNGERYQCLVFTPH